MEDNKTTEEVLQRIDALSGQLSDVNTRLERIEALLISLTRDVEGVQSSTQNMDDHISFVNGVYQQVRQPFHALIGAANRFIQPSAKDVIELDRLRLEDTDEVD